MITVVRTILTGLAWLVILASVCLVGLILVQGYMQRSRQSPSTMAARPAPVAQAAKPPAEVASVVPPEDPLTIAPQEPPQADSPSTVSATGPAIPSPLFAPSNPPPSTEVSTEDHTSVHPFQPASVQDGPNTTEDTPQTKDPPKDTPENTIENTAEEIKDTSEEDAPPVEDSPQNPTQVLETFRPTERPWYGGVGRTPRL